MRFLSPALLAGALLLVSACDSTSATGGPPQSARIVKVTVIDAPLRTPEGDLWDGSAGGGPEIYFGLFDDFIDYHDIGNGALDDSRLDARNDDGSVIALTSNQPWYESVDALDLPLVWDVDPGYVVRNLDDPLYLALFDYDPTTADDPMAESDVFVLRDYAPRGVDGQADVITLSGLDRDGVRANVNVRLTVIFDD